MKDERTTQLLQKIYTEMTLIIILLCALSMCIKILIYEQNLNNCILEWIILVGSPVYRLIRSRMLKVPMLTGPYNFKEIIKKSAASIILLIGVFGLMAIFRPEKFTLTFVTTFLVPYCILTIIIRIAMTKSEERHAKKLNEEYDD